MAVTSMINDNSIRLRHLEQSKIILVIIVPIIKSKLQTFCARFFLSKGHAESLVQRTGRPRGTKPISIRVRGAQTVLQQHATDSCAIAAVVHAQPAAGSSDESDARRPGSSTATESRGARAQQAPVANGTAKTSCPRARLQSANASRQSIRSACPKISVKDATLLKAYKSFSHTHTKLYNNSRYL